MLDTRCGFEPGASSLWEQARRGRVCIPPTCPPPPSALQSWEGGTIYPNCGGTREHTEITGHGQWGAWRKIPDNLAPEAGPKPWLCSYTRSHLQNRRKGSPPKLASTVTWQVTWLGPHRTQRPQVTDPCLTAWPVRRYRTTRSYTQTTCSKCHREVPQSAS